MNTTAEDRITPEQETNIRMQDKLSEQLNDLGLSHDDYEDIMRRD